MDTAHIEHNGHNIEMAYNSATYAFECEVHRDAMISAAAKLKLTFKAQYGTTEPKTLSFDLSTASGVFDLIFEKVYNVQ